MYKIIESYTQNEILYRLVRAGSRDVVLNQERNESNISFFYRAKTYLNDHQLPYEAASLQGLSFPETIEGWEKVDVDIVAPGEGHMYYVRAKTGEAMALFEINNQLFLSYLATEKGNSKRWIQLGTCTKENYLDVLKEAIMPFRIRGFLQPQSL